MSSNIAADRLYLLWLIKEQVFSGMDGSVPIEEILDNILNLLAGSPDEMMGSNDEKLYLQSEGQERVKEMETLISRASRYLTPDQVTYPQGTEEEVC